MKIQDTQLGAAPAVAPVRTGTATDKPAPARSEAAERAAIAASIPFDAAKVARLKSEIAAGTYRVDASKIADELIASARDLIRTRKKV